MSYEYKNEIIEDVKAHCKDKNKNIAVYPIYHYEDKVEEIHNVYSQASKADEYEAKAVAFDRIKAYSDKAINGDIHSLLLAEGIIDVVEQYDINRLSERGGSDD